MGWLFGWESQRDVKNHCLSELENFEVIGHKSTSFGKNLWVACKDRKDGKSFIVLFLLSKSDGEWGYKDIDESMGPYAKDCPISLLEKTSGLDSEYSKKWRSQVIEYHEKLKQLGKDVQIGEIIEVYGKKYEIVDKINRHFRGVSLENGRVYRIKKTQIKRLI